MVQSKDALRGMFTYVRSVKQKPMAEMLWCDHQRSIIDLT